MSGGFFRYPLDTTGRAIKLVVTERSIANAANEAVSLIGGHGGCQERAPFLCVPAWRPPRQKEHAVTLPPSLEPLAQAASQHENVPFGQPPHRKLNVKEAAAYLGLSVSTLNKMRLTGTGPPYMKLGRRVVYDLRDLEDWAAQRKRNHTSE
jgi:predicted DNA-binding transcriptional regulator AlpA